MTTKTKRTLLQAMVLAGFPRQKELVEAIHKLDPDGKGVPQPVVSDMLRGDRAYPKARALVAKALKCSEQALDRLLAESAPI